MYVLSNLRNYLRVMYLTRSYSTVITFFLVLEIEIVMMGRCSSTRMEFGKSPAAATKTLHQVKIHHGRLENSRVHACVWCRCPRVARQAASRNTHVTWRFYVGGVSLMNGLRHARGSNRISMISGRSVLFLKWGTLINTMVELTHWS